MSRHRVFLYPALALKRLYYRERERQTDRQRKREREREMVADS